MSLARPLLFASLLLGCALLGGLEATTNAGEPPSPTAKASSTGVEYTAPEKHHFNAEAPNRAWLIGEGAPGEKTPLPLKLKGRKARVSLSAPSRTSGAAQVRADLFLCDDAKTFCVKKTITVPVPPPSGSRSEAAPAASRTIAASGPENEMEGWIAPPKGRTIRGVAMMVHGLNLRPDKMNAIGGVLAEAGYLTWRAALTGHRGLPEDAADMKGLTRERWIADIDRAARIVQTEAETRQIPVIVAGYSLGGLLAVDYLTRRENAAVRPERMILFAPGISIRPAFHALSALSFLGKSFVVPSRSLKEYRSVIEGTAMGAYLASDDSLKAVETALNSGRGARIAETPTLVVMDPEDELIHLKGIRKLIEGHRFKAWSVLEVSNVATEVKGANHHFIIDERALGKEVWASVGSRIQGFLEGKPASGAITRAEICGRSGVWRTLLRSECRDDSWTGCNRAEHACKPVSIHGQSG